MPFVFAIELLNRPPFAAEKALNNQALGAESLPWCTLSFETEECQSLLCEKSRLPIAGWTDWKKAMFPPQPVRCTKYLGPRGPNHSFMSSSMRVGYRNQTALV